MLRKRRILSRLKEDVDPVAGAANLVDAILVFACGLLVALVISWNLHSVIFSTATPEEKRMILEAVRQVVQIKKGKEINDLPDAIKGSGEGYQEEGTVYRDPKTGKLIMVTPGR
jgi:hypothetical protein